MPLIRYSLRILLQRLLSPTVLDFVRVCNWYVSFYFPRLATSRFVKCSPEIYTFGDDSRAPRFLNQLRNVNTLAPTKMCRIMTKYGSDKGSGWHNFTTAYSVLFKEHGEQPLRIFELGLGINDPEDVSKMWGNGRPGASLRGWRELFPHALVYGADINRRILFREDRIKTFYCHQLSPESIRELWSEPDLKSGMDIIIEDGFHTFEANLSFLEGSLEHLRPGGTYIIEDIAREFMDQWRERVETMYLSRYPEYKFAFVVLPNSLNTIADNNLLVVHRIAK